MTNRVHSSTDLKCFVILLKKTKAVNRNYDIQLTDVQSRELKRLVEFGRHLTREITRARILLLADTGIKDQEIAEALQISIGTVYNVRKRFSEEKSIKSLEEKQHPGKPSKLDGITRGLIKCLASSEPPEGRKRWTLRLLAARAAEIESVGAISHESIRKILKKRIVAA
jgi:transposase